jgi:ABC-type transport system involved in cytochrome c biogenesis permease subunit
MSGRIPAWLFAALALLLLLAALRPQQLADKRYADFAMPAFGRLPVLEGGRLKPLDTVARNNLVLFRGKQTALDTEGRRLQPLQWLADVLFDQATAASHRVFRVDNPDLLGLLGSSGADVVHFSYQELLPHLAEIDRQARLAPEEAALRNLYQKAVIRLRIALITYQSLEAALVPAVRRGETTSGMFQRYQEVLPQGLGLLQGMQTGDMPQGAELNDFIQLVTVYQQMADSRAFLALPTWTDTPQSWRAGAWSNTGTPLLAMVHGGPPDPLLGDYMHLADAWRGGDASAFNAAIADVETHIRERVTDTVTRSRFEFFFNQFEPFYVSLQLYVLAFIAVCVLWMSLAQPVQQAAFAILCLAMLVHTFGLAARVYMSGYAPVTNLYSSAVFVGWGAVLCSLPMERLYRNGLAAAAAALTGFATLIIAHNLAVAGGADTLEMMRAVLDSNFWLSTHVTTITIGYSATFLAGALAVFYILRGVLTRSLDMQSARSLERMVYGITCFALLFSFVGTVLGGIWADQSWGRFWGWDPKENGALMIVIWCALMLHAKRIRMAGPRGFMQLAVGGGIITSWSWFGTNMLGVGLHSYGFMDKAFLWMILFWLSQLALIALAAVPPHRWRSPVAGGQ